MSPKRLIDLLRRPPRENLFGRIAVGRLPSDGSDTDARCQQEACEAAYRRPVKQWSVAAGASRTWRGSVCFGFSVVSISAPYPVQCHRIRATGRVTLGRQRSATLQPGLTK